MNGGYDYIYEKLGIIITVLLLISCNGENKTSSSSLILSEESSSIDSSLISSIIESSEIESSEVESSSSSSSTVIDLNEYYQLTGFAKDKISNRENAVNESGYVIVKDEIEFILALKEKSTKVIEITSDLNLGFNEVKEKFEQKGLNITDYKGVFLEANKPLTHTGDSYGALIARINSKEASITKVAAIDCEVLVVDPIKYAGGLVGYAEIDVTLSDIYVDIKVVEEKEMVGGVVSRVKSGATVNASRVVAFVDLTGAKNVGGIIGKNEGTANLSEVLVSVTILSGNNYAGAIVGNGTANVENVYQYNFTGSQSNGFNGTEVTALDVASLTWWQENMPTFDFENVWDLTDGVITLR